MRSSIPSYFSPAVSINLVCPKCATNHKTTYIYIYIQSGHTWHDDCRRIGAKKFPNPLGFRVTSTSLAYTLYGQVPPKMKVNNNNINICAYAIYWCDVSTTANPVYVFYTCCAPRDHKRVLSHVQDEDYILRCCCCASAVAVVAFWLAPLHIVCAMGASMFMCVSVCVCRVRTPSERSKASDRHTARGQLEFNIYTWRKSMEWGASLYIYKYGVIVVHVPIFRFSVPSFLYSACISRSLRNIRSHRTKRMLLPKVELSTAYVTHTMCVDATFEYTHTSIHSYKNQ